ncbi:ATP-binding protein [Gallaecimonas xiamenensis]|uniref:histidine kinase n=1 Tax=Gallaecimonas xiamenensis 3-C-1 TaxID=745411 RepID=K2IHH5_9GAMM|nr:ATP-binding protein [Gallaecimonas xiamenensis]EKE69556.1 histidine kinase [Gallaecimonas xiamenensis 3-C-1]
MSFRLRTLAWLLGLSLLAASLTGVLATYIAADDEFQDVLADDLKHQAKLLAALVNSAQVDPQRLEALLGKYLEEDGEDTLWVSLYRLDDGTLLSNLKHRLPLERSDSGSLQREFDGHHWHGYQRRQGDLVVQLLRRDDLTRDIQADIAEEITTPTLVSSAISLLLLAALMWLTLRPLTRLVRELEQRQPDDLSPLKVRSPAREIASLTASLNRLMAGVDQVLSRERRFASDVAHELRTPLTTLKLELAGPDPDLKALRQETERLARVVEQLLTLARLEQGHWQQRFNSLALGPALAQLAERYQPRFAARDMALTWQLDQGQVRGDATLLLVLAENLLSNALRHCPGGTRVQLGWQQGELWVRDDGPGLAAEQRARMAEPFTRLDSKSDGLGLGLAICQQVAEIHGARLSFDDGQPGLWAGVHFPT